MSQPTPAPLLRLREADVVRLCGLDAAARGLELVDSRAVRAPHREGGRLQAVVEHAGSVRVWWEQAAEDGSGGARWGCERDHPAHADPAEGAAPRLCCAHVAALLTAWIRAPSDFVAPAASLAAREGRSTAESEHITQPALLPAQAWPRTLGEHLHRLPSDELAALCRRLLGVELDLPETEARAALERFLSDPAQVSALAQRLDDRPRALLVGVLLLGGAATAADLDGWAERAGQAPSALRGDAETLRRNGLLFSAAGGASAHAAHAHGWRAVKGWHIPPETRAALALDLPLEPLPQRGVAGPPLLVRSGNAGTQPRVTLRVQQGSPRPLLLALALSARAPALYNPYNPLHSPAASAPPAAARSSSPLPTFLIPGELPAGPLADFARAAGLSAALLAMARRLLLWGRAAGLHFDASAIAAGEWPVLLRLAFGLWCDAESPFELADLAGVGAVRPVFDIANAAFSPSALAAEVRAGRAFLLRALAAARPGAWYALDGFLELLWRLDPLFLRGRQQAFASPAWWLERAEARRPLNPVVHEEWRASEGEYVRTLLIEPLRWWGALDLATDPADRAPVAFRLTDLGRYLLDARGAARPPETLFASQWGPAVLATRDGALSVHPLVCGAALLDALDAWARVTRVAGGRLVYTIDADRLCAAFDAGQTPYTLTAALRTLLGEASARAAASSARRLHELYARYGASRIYAGWALVEAHDEATLAEALAAAPELGTRAQRLAPTAALLPPADAAALEALLRRRGVAV